MFNRQLVLVAVDRATKVRRVMEVALGIARAREADIHVINVVPHRAASVSASVAPWVVGGHDGAVDLRARLRSILQSSDDGVHVRSITLRGEPERVVPAYAGLHQASILVVESHYGTSRFWRSGRVVDELARRSPMPLLVLPKRRRRDRDQRGLHRILTPFDFSIASAVALRTAADLSRRHGARVTLVHALTDVPGRMVFSGSEAWEVVRRLPAQLEAVADRLRRKAASVGAGDVDAEVATGTSDVAILEMVERRDADLVVMGVAHRSWLDRLAFGSTLRRLLRRVTVPVLVVPVVAGDNPWPDEAGLGEVSSRMRTDSVERVAA
jgi:nucleotide-binding universal stress UspA family protein